MLCEQHRKQEQIYEPEQQFARHLDLGSFLLDKQVFAEAEEMLGCAFALFECGLVPMSGDVVTCFVRLVQSLEKQGKQELLDLYLEKGKDLDFKSAFCHPVAKRRHLHIVSGDDSEV